MAHQEEGWPLGLRPVNARIGGLTRGTHHHHHHEQVSAGSISFSSLLSPSPSSQSSSDLDSQSMGSFFRDRSYTLGNLIGISSFLELSRRSNRTRNDQTGAARNHQHHKNLKTYYKPWIFSICSKLSTNATVISHNRIINEENDGRNNVQSLGHFLIMERRAVGSTIRSTPTPTPTM
ncbi:hypothetical protein AtNW77_Chr5g0085021 [Arabidopsis thaliana]|uniref:60S ribosomal protein L36 n=3 Tax=Arabidopsis TaxID=3701 RepID=Q9LZ58_ARATH|nr:60S ribosomal protein L36 [Arabidopsis thaliana]KAG7600902.1 hypothetical protein ISN45_At05g001440 [Arabidopsis thaliana x Arabidopsis arenosa]ABK59668.1 At5g02440 [Arabidopsis thaliana]AED90472.1 60S ribosomal protein L36 [Arabidopsis thaliana]OAO94115.1 hypothetical protein AXX17_AT5G01570 [Arabidopsis thaliana]CAB85981.1 putative protein [Arabidopsis thaliana]|eukprot:NP_195864.1 60S ribosomal protein L36 [Arabidopsis thaliana]